VRHRPILARGLSPDQSYPTIFHLASGARNRQSRASRLHTPPMAHAQQVQYICARCAYLITISRPLCAVVLAHRRIPVVHRRLRLAAFLSSILVSLLQFRLLSLLVLCYLALCSRVRSSEAWTLCCAACAVRRGAPLPYPGIYMG
jgi:hypothetical protein